MANGAIVANATGSYVVRWNEFRGGDQSPAVSGRSIDGLVSAAVTLGLVGAYATFVVFAWRDHDEYEIPADEVARLDRENLAARLNIVSAAGALR